MPRELLERAVRRAVDHAVRVHHVRVDVHHPVRVTRSTQRSRPLRQQAEIRRRGQRDDQVRLFAAREVARELEVVTEVVGQLAGEPRASEAGPRKPAHAHSVDVLLGREPAAAPVGPLGCDHRHVVTGRDQRARDVVQVVPGRSEIGRVKLVQQDDAHRSGPWLAACSS